VKAMDEDILLAILATSKANYQVLIQK